MWVPPDTRDRVVDFVNDWSERAEMAIAHFIRWLGISTSKFYGWRARYGKENEHNGKIPRDFWLEVWEKQAIMDFYEQHREDGYRRVAFMMLDGNVVAASPTSVWRVLHESGLLRRRPFKPSRKGTGFDQPQHPHEHWHIDVSYLNIWQTFGYPASDIVATRSERTWLEEEVGG